MTDSHDPKDDDTRIVEVYSAANEIEAAAVRAALDAAGIRARLVGDRLGNVWGEVPLGFQSEPKLWVREEDADAARRLIAEFHAQSGEAAAVEAFERDAAEHGEERSPE